jgi:hypothetical protein
MLSFLPTILLAQSASVLPQIERKLITQYQEVRQLPGQLNDVLVFNSNSPEIVEKEGILLSTFPGKGKRYPVAHLNHPLQGRFDVFTHHIARQTDPNRNLHQGLIVTNPTSKNLVIRILQGVSYVTSADAPFVDLPSLVEDPNGRVFSGPGSRLASDIMRRRHDTQFPTQIVIPPGESRMLLDLVIPRSSARSTLLRLYSDGPIYMANLALYEVPQKVKIEDREIETFRPPILEEWRTLLVRGDLAAPRDFPPTPPDQWSPGRRNFYGRVAGISVGSEWATRIVDPKGGINLTIPQPGQAFAYPLSTVTAATFGTRQIQSAPMLVRYPDTAFKAHGNYGVHYYLTLPLYNNTSKTQVVALTIQTPIKEDNYLDRLLFVEPVQGPVFFRGAVRVTYRNELGRTEERFFHLVQREGQQGEALVQIELPPGARRDVNLDFLYPPDATPPQVLSVKTLK